MSFLSHIRAMFLVLVLFLVWVPSSTSIEEVEVKNDGTVPDGGGDVSASVSDSFRISVNNRMDEKMTVYWYDAKKVSKHSSQR